MAHEPYPDDPLRVRDASRPSFGDDGPGREARLERDLQMDPELAEGPAGSGKIALLVLGIAVLLGVVFYGLNNSSTHPSATSSTAQNTAPASPPAAPPGMRDVTPRNTGQGMTTGAAPSQTAPPPAPASNAPASK